MTYQEQLPPKIHEYALKEFQHEMECLYYPDLYVLPLSVEGEIELERLYHVELIGRYGCYVRNFIFEGDTYLAVIVNND